MKKYLFIGLMLCSIYGYADTNTANHQTSNTNENNLLVQLVDTKIANMEDKLARVEKSNQDSIAEVKSSVDDKLADKFKQLDDRAGDIDHWFKVIDWILTILFFVIPFVGYWINSKVNENIKTSKEELDKFTKDASDKINKQLEDTNTMIKDKLEYADRLLAQIKENHTISNQLTEELKKSGLKSNYDKIISGSKSNYDKLKLVSEIGNENNDDIAAISKVIREVSENQLTAKDWFIRGLDAISKQEYYEAITYFTNAIKESSSDEARCLSYNNRGNSKAMLSQYNEAILDYNEAIKINPLNGNLYNNRGRAKESLKLYLDAIEDYNTAIKLNPNDYTAYNNLGLTKAELRKYDEAIQDFDNAIKINPQFADAHFNKACAYALLKNKPAALQSLDDALKLGHEIEYVSANNVWNEYLNDTDFKALINKYNKDNNAKQD